MEFWGVEVKAGQSIKCDPGFDKYLHLSQAALGESKKDKANEVVLSLKVGGQTLILGTLASEKFPQLSFDLVFEKEFELSHNGKTSVHLCGYKTLVQDEDPEGFSDSEDESEDELELASNGMPEVKEKSKKPTVSNNKASAPKPESSAPKPKAKVPDQIKAVKPAEDDDDDDDDEDEDDTEDDESDSDEDMLGVGGDSDDDDEDDESSEDEDEATPKKVEVGKKRASDSASKVPAPEKKAKLVTPVGQKTGGDGKKGAHTATPHPNKQAGKTPASNPQSAKKQSPKSPGQVMCKPCNKSFKSDGALESHNKAKHNSDK